MLRSPRVVPKNQKVAKAEDSGGGKAPFTQSEKDLSSAAFDVIFMSEHGETSPEDHPDGIPGAVPDPVPDSRENVDAVSEKSLDSEDESRDAVPKSRPRRKVSNASSSPSHKQPANSDSSRRPSLADGMRDMLGLADPASEMLEEILDKSLYQVRPRSKR